MQLMSKDLNPSIQITVCSSNSAHGCHILVSTVAKLWEPEKIPRSVAYADGFKAINKTKENVAPDTAGNIIPQYGHLRN
jgi:hypothetical protein